MQDFDIQVERFLVQFIDKQAYKEVLQGLQNTMIIALYGFILGIVIGTLIAIVRVLPKNNMMPKSGTKIVRIFSYIRSYVIPKLLDGFCTLYVGIFRGTPIVVQLLVFYYVVLPLMGLERIDSITVAIIVFGMNSGAYISEIMRGGILSVDPGQMEGGRSVGMSYSATMMKIVIPQAVKNILPTLGNEFIALVKDTSVVSFVAAVDLYKTFTEIGNVRYEYLMPYFAMAIMYIVLVMLISLGVKLIERRLKRNERSA